MAYHNFLRSANNLFGQPQKQGANAFLSMVDDELLDSDSSTSSHYKSNQDMFEDLTTWEEQWQT